MQKILENTIAVGSLIGNHQFVKKDLHSLNIQPLNNLHNLHNLHNLGVILISRIYGFLAGRLNFLLNIHFL